MAKKILIVEDNADHLELTVLTLQELGAAAEIVVARDGAEALNYLWGQGPYADRDTEEQPVLVMLDMKLPKLSGLEVLRSLRSHALTAHVPVVMLTSSCEASDMLACYQQGANGFVRKPVDFQAFTEKLKHLQAYWIEVNEAVSRH